MKKQLIRWRAPHLRRHQQDLARLFDERCEQYDCNGNHAIKRLTDFLLRPTSQAPMEYSPRFALIEEVVTHIGRNAEHCNAQFFNFNNGSVWLNWRLSRYWLAHRQT